MFSEHRKFGRKKKKRDHCQLTGQRTGALQFSWKSTVEKVQCSFVPVILQNFSNYDSHIFVETLMKTKGTKFSENQIKSCFFLRMVVLTLRNLWDLRVKIPILHENL